MIEDCQKPDRLFCIENGNGVVVKFCNKGGRLYSIELKKKNIALDILAGASSVNDYLKQDPYMGALCGRFANRIENATFTLDGKPYVLTKNDGENHLHGGNYGFSHKHWKVNKLNNRSNPAYKLHYFSKDGEEGYPGNLEVDVIYELSDSNEFIIDISAKTDKPCVVNLTSHPYFNLKGFGNILDHTLTIFADQFCEVKDDLIPTGEMLDVKGTVFDFLEAKRLSALYLERGIKGVDHNFVLQKHDNELSLAAVLEHKPSDVKLEVYTTQNCLQVYTGNHFNCSKMAQKNGFPLKPFDAIALEAQDFPDAPNKNFISNAFLLPNETYHQVILYKMFF